MKFYGSIPNPGSENWSDQDEENYEKQIKKEELKSKTLGNEEKSQTILARISITKLLFRILKYWLIFVATIILFQGSSNFDIYIPYFGGKLTNYIQFSFKISDNIIITFLTTATIKIIGLIFLIIKFYFK